MPDVTISTHIRGRAVPLEADGPTALRELRRALSEMLAGLPPVSRAVDLGALLEIDRSLAWKVWRVAQGPEELPSPKHVPGRGAIAVVLRAAAARGATADAIEGVRDAHARLEAVFKKHAGDRASAEIMLGQFTSEGRSRLEMQLRREAYRAYSHFLGVRLRTRHQLDVLTPSPAGSAFMPQLARVRGYYGLERTRADARWVLSRGFVLHEGVPTGDYKRTPLAATPGAADIRDAVPMVPTFCAPADLPLLRERGPGHTYVDELGPGQIGSTGAADIVTAELISEVPRRAGGEDVLGVHIRTPAERLCYEMLLHRDLARLGSPRLEVFTTLNLSVPQAAPDPRDRVPIMEQLRTLGPVAAAPRAIEVPRHSDLCEWVLERLGANPADYFLYRFAMKFPPVAIVLRVTYPVAP